MQQNGPQGGSKQNEKPKQSGLSWSQPAPASINKQTKPPTAQVPPPRTTPMVPAYMQQKGGPKQGNRKFLGILAGGVLLGFIVGWAWFAFRPATDEGPIVTNGNNTENTTEENTSTGGTNTSTTGGTGTSSTGGSDGGGIVPVTVPGVQAAANDFVSVPTPQAPGNRVLISGLTVSVPTWIVVYDNKGGVRGNALGAALFFPTSPNSPINIALLRSTIAGQSYFIGRRVDNGDKIFSMQSDAAVIDAGGNPVYQTLIVQ